MLLWGMQTTTIDDCKKLVITNIAHLVFDT